METFPSLIITTFLLLFPIAFSIFSLSSLSPYLSSFDVSPSDLFWGCKQIKRFTNFLFVYFLVPSFFLSTRVTVIF